LDNKVFNQILWYPSWKSRAVPCEETVMTNLKVAFS